MGIVKEFIVTFVELTAILVLWSKYTLKHKNKFLVNSLIAFIGSAVMVITAKFNIYLNIGISYFIVVFFIYFFYKKSIIKVILEFFIILTLFIILQLLGIAIFDTFIGTYENQFITNLVINSVILILSIFIYYLIPVIKPQIFIELNKRIVAYFVVNFLGYVLISKIIWDYDKNLILDNAMKFIFIIIIMLTINAIMYFYFLKIEKEKREAMVQVKYNEVLKSITGEIRERQHDFKNHLNVIAGLTEVSEGEELKTQIKKYIYNLDSSLSNMEKLIYINNPILRAIIYSKIHEANNKDIILDYKVENPLERISITDYQLVEVLGNLIDNSIEALEKSNFEKRATVKTYFEDDMNIIEVSNAGRTISLENINKVFQKGFSTKGRNNRGYGLYNVKKIVERNGGKIQLSFDDNNTTFKLFIL